MMALKESSEVVILEDEFYFYPSLSTTSHLKLTEKILYIKYSTKGKCETEEVVLNDVIGCHVFRGKTEKSKNDAKDVSAYICLYSYPLKSSSSILGKQLRRERRALTFQMRKSEFQDENMNIVNRWRRTILCLLKGNYFYEGVEIQIPFSIPSNPKLLILINPHSGCGKAHQIFKERVRPLLAESDTPYELLITDRANCARDYVKRADLSQWNAIVVVSGDGLLFEVYNGLMSRPDWHAAVKMPVGVIPGGSGNGLARALSYASGEPYDVTIVTPSVMNIIRGHITPMDLVHVQTAKESFYSFLSIGWGLMADIDIESERLRAFGEARFAVWAVIRAIGLRKYRGKLSYLPVTDYDLSKQTKALIEPKPKRSKTLDSRLAWAEESPLENESTESIKHMFRSRSIGGHDAEINEENDHFIRLFKFNYCENENDLLPNIENSDNLSKQKQFDSIINIENKDILHENLAVDNIKENIPFVENQFNSKEESFLQPSSYCPDLGHSVPEDWVVIEDDFVLVYACHQTHLSTDVLFAPSAKLDDGIMWLIVIRSGVTRAQVMYFLASLQTGDHVNIPYVDVTPIHAFRLEPSNSDGVLTVDGEVIPCGIVQAEVLPSIARVMIR